jgi:hypothetical protein
MKRNLLLLLGVVFVLSACTVKGPEVEVRPPEVIVDSPVKVETDDYSPPHRHPGPRHCPPGHAKKGWC